MKLEQVSWSSTPNGAFPSSSDTSSIIEASSLTSESTRESGFKTHNSFSNGSENFEKEDLIFSDESTAVATYSFNDDLGDITQTSNDMDFFENTKEKDSGDFLYHGLPEIGSFDDVDRMFRSSDSTFGLGTNEEDELNWLSSADDIGGTGDMLKSDFRLPYPELYVGNDILQNDNPTKTYYVNEPAMACAPFSLKDSSWSPEKYESSMSLVEGPAITESKDMFILKEQMDEHKKQSKNQNQPDGESKNYYIGNVNFNCIDSDQTTVTQMPSSIKSKTKDLLNRSSGDSSRASSQLQSLEGFHHSLLVTAIEGNEKRENLHFHPRSQQFLNSNLGNTCVTMLVPTSDPDSAAGSKFENHHDVDAIDSVILSKLGSTNALESSTMNSSLDDISLEAASFLQLQLVMEQLDLKMKLCIRDSLYRLARSAERRHNHANLDDACGDEREAGRAFAADGFNKLTGSMDMETDTNPIDRSIAHLLFHRPSETSAVPANDSLPFRSPRMVHRSTTTIMADNLVSGEETSAERDKIVCNQ